MAQLIEEDVAKRLLKGITIPPQPQIMVDLQLEMTMSGVSIERIAAIICKDAGISGSVLKVVNSPFFGLTKRITSIKQALSLLGINNIINIVNSVSISNSLSQTNFVEMTHFWDNAVDVAMAAATISRRTGLGSVDESYTLGLFHNCGIPMLMGKFPQYRQILLQAYRQEAQRITDLENEAISCNHAVIGFYVARAWKLPNYLCEVIADHHKTEAIFAEQINYDKTQKNLLAILKLAENICKTHRTLGETAKDHEFERIKKHLLIYLGFSEYDFEDLRAAISDIGLI